MKRNELLKTLEIVGQALATDNLVPMWQNYMFQNGTVLAYNNSLGIVAHANVGSEFACNGKTLLGLIRNSTGETVDLKLDDDNLTVKSGRSTFKLPWAPKDEFLFEEPEGDWAVKLPLNKALLSALAACLKTASTDLMQQALATVCLTATDKTLMLYSCNGDAVTACPLGGIKEKIPYHLMTAEFCKAVLRTAKELEVSDGELLLNEKWSCAELGGFTIYGQLVAKDSPVDHAKLIKDTLGKNSPTFLPVPDEFRAALQRAMVVTEAETAPTVITVEAGRLKLVSQTHMGVVRDSIAFPNHPEVTATVSARMLNEALDLCTELTIFENCCVLKGENLSVLLSNMG